MTRTICEGLQVIEMGAGSIGASLAGMLLAGLVVECLVANRTAA